jgi:hypothetical protein
MEKIAQALAFVSALIFGSPQPAPKPMVQVDYCWMDQRWGVKVGKKWHPVWTKYFAPCRLLDRYENI